MTTEAQPGSRVEPPAGVPIPVWFPDGIAVAMNRVQFQCGLCLSFHVTGQNRSAKRRSSGHGGPEGFPCTGRGGGMHCVFCEAPTARCSSATAVGIKPR